MLINFLKSQLDVVIVANIFFCARRILLAFERITCLCVTLVPTLSGEESRNPGPKRYCFAFHSKLIMVD